jgi:hypothetical protein
MSGTYDEHEHAVNEWLSSVATALDIIIISDVKNEVKRKVRGLTHEYCARRVVVESWRR